VAGSLDGEPAWSVRAPAAAGLFYPAEAERIAAIVDGFLQDAARRHDVPAEPPSAIVVPHAGYRYSGRVAASAYACVAAPGIPSAAIRRVVVLGPAHFVSLEGCAVPGVDAWRTPLGEVGIDGRARDLARAAGVAVDDAPHAGEHSIEVQVPLLQRMIEPGFGILPVAVGRSEAAGVADVIEAVATSPGTLVVVSTDLSHYHPDDEARRLDERTARAVVEGRPGDIGRDAACGRSALLGLVEHVRRRGSEVRLLDLRTSADSGGDRRNVVGYGAFSVR
jgi:AmmeMemoRadiSam system protein B